MDESIRKCLNNRDMKIFVSVCDGEGKHLDHSVPVCASLVEKRGRKNTELLAHVCL